MKYFPLVYKQRNPLSTYFLLLLIACVTINNSAIAQTAKPVLYYTVSMPYPSSHYYHVELFSSGWSEGTVDFKMPKWMPGYYQIMNYAKAVEHFSAKDNNNNVPVKNINDNTWQIAVTKNKPFNISYDVKADRQFVANSYLDSTRGYIIPNGLFVYIDGHLNTPVSVKILTNKNWSKIATGLEPVAGKLNEFTAPGFDILYDCPILMGNLEELPSFKVNGIEHRFIGYKLGDFDRIQFMANLKKVIEAAVAVIGDIPYKQYTFIGIGPGQGGIEHLNNTTVSFNGKGLNTADGMNRTMNFLAHEYFHHYNVKRIRPFELGPFNYDKENKTNLLWVSEGLSVYYEYLIVKRAGLISEQSLFNNFESSINAFENNPGRLYQSLTQASYETWSDGPFGKQGEDAKKSISYYDKGPVVGLILDFAIRHATQNKKSLDDVMRLLYWQYYKTLQRGFTDAEFQQACESLAGISLAHEFEYVYTTKELYYNTYLAYAGLKIDVQAGPEKDKRKFFIQPIEKPDELQSAILQSWLTNQVGAK